MTDTKDLPPMEYRNLGRTGLKVSAISLGGWLTYGGNVEDPTTFNCMKAAYDAGINFFDSAEGYAGGASEIAMGKAIKKFGWKQNDLVISTKLYWGAANGTNPVNNRGLSRKHIIEGMDLSLKRLDLPYVDIVYAHRPDRETPIEETVRAFNHLINTGKVFYWGTSEWSASEIAAAWRVADKLGLVGPCVEQPQYNLLSRDRVEAEYRWLYEAHGLGLTVFSPLKQGILTGKYNNVDAPPADSRLATGTDDFTKKFAKSFGDETWKKQLAVVDNLKPIAEELDCTLGQLALAWALKNPNVASLITGASRPEQIYQNVQSLAVLKKLTPEIIEKIEKAADNKPKVEVTRF